MAVRVMRRRGERGERGLFIRVMGHRGSLVRGGELMKW